MIRRITEQETLSPIVFNYCRQLSQLNVSTDATQAADNKISITTPFSGDIDTTYATRVTLASDNSIYQELPQAALFPKNENDLLLITQLANDKQFSAIKFSPRGGGTGTNGQSLTEHVIVDMSRYMREIIEINLDEKWVRVQSGVIKDQLNDYLRPYGYFFAPDLSTSNRATIGGMVNTDASGQGSLVYGKTSDHVLALESVTISGHKLSTKPLPVTEVKTIIEEKSPLSPLYLQVFKTGYEHREEILNVFPRLNRFLTGYDLEHVFNDDMTSFDLSRVLTGSEGTLAFVTEAKLNITPIAKFKTLINVKYDSFDSALRNSPFLVEAHATSVETIDSKVLGLAKQDVVWDTVSDLIQSVPGKVMDGLNIVEFNDEVADSQQIKVESLCARLDQLINSEQAGVIGYQVINDLGAIQRIYGMRKKAVGLLGNTKGNKKPIAFAEDTAVPPENLADYIAEFRQLLDSYNLDYGMFGHVDAGVLHVRPALDLTDPEQETLLRTISDKVVALTAKYGGLMWGEHGKGYRSEYGPAFFGEKLFAEVQKIKAQFDPQNRLNPGKICTPYKSTDKMVSVDAVKRASFDKQIPIEIKTEFETTVNCNGNGQCFNYDTSSPMCPSYKASNDRRYSPKGRASLMREWLRLQGNTFSADNREMYRTGFTQLLTFPYKVFRTAGAKLGNYDFNHEVKASMDECLACKACTTACPIKVDVPTFRTKFIEAYYSRYLRPISDHLVANVEGLLPLLSRTPSVGNLIMHNPISAWVTRNLVGYVDAPKFGDNLRKAIANENWYSPERVNALSEQQKQRAVFIVQDPFTSAYESSLVVDTVSVLTKLGYLPIVLPFYANGKPAHVKGFVSKFARIAAKATTFFNKVAQHNIPMIGLDASLVFAYRDEYIKALGKDAVKFDVMVLSEWLKDVDVEVEVTPSLQSQATYTLLAHCTEKSIINGVEKHWVSIFNKVGLNLNIRNTGCCGMAGTFGHEKQHQETSKTIYNLSWKHAVAQEKPELILATGFSCRSQVKRLDGVELSHPIQMLDKVLS
ncbi:FAD-binding oxidoreductase [Psychrosphaera sp. B3R10]|uniref:D-2-hydroxyglutarate dehydrogenase YdiJ n=1 Tax=unclassified Psychrosphaera TaxID=2641570 RepID=UPI001C08003B|nr:MULTISPECIES: FAD-binding and (Fe-S)-binding domain-containing protein [unclassified Psychrosphaera]MBU2882303.1 FAD-binding oxidoreductase [Psychrosphaera sp. I2R16]MBU2988984.1 FAD-binding oxidoreductase [Psychrosphaera sp. B3R10]